MEKNIYTHTHVFISIYACVLSRVQLFETIWILARQAPLSMGFPRQECWSGSPFPSPGGLPGPGTATTSPALAGVFFTTEPTGKSIYTQTHTHTNTYPYLYI